ncbi:hypothetical protein ACFLVJ_02970 [Chloroflexota bacterium]
MGKRIWIVGIILVAALALILGAGPAFAHGNPTPGDGEAWNGEDYCSGYGMMGRGHTGLMGGVILEPVADVLGLTTEELQARLEDGATIAEIAGEEGVDLSMVVDAILAPHTEMIEARVQDGYLTEGEAEAILKQHRLHIEETITEFTYGEYGLHCGEADGKGYGQTRQHGRGGHGHGMMGSGMMGGGMMGSW